MNILCNGGFLGREALCYQFREIIKQLDKNHDVRIDSQPIGGYWEKFFGKFKDKKPSQIYIMNGHVTYLPELAKKHKNIISITVFETKLPDKWVDALNIPEVKQIWTVSEFCKNLIVEGGVKKPVKVIYLGVDKRFYKNDVNMFLKDNSFKFINVSAPHCLGKRDRKGLDILLNSFKQEFGDDPKVTLILKINTIYADLYNRQQGRDFILDDYITDLLPRGTKKNNIVLLTNYFDTAILNNFYNSVDCGVFPARAEGFNFPAAEMIKIGKPVITTEFSGHSEFSDKRLQTKILGMWPLDYCVYPYEDSEFSEPDINHLRKLMRQVYENYQEEKKLAEEHSKTISKFTWDKVGERMEEFLKW